MKEDVKKFFMESEFSEYYFLACSRQEYLDLSGLKEIDRDHKCNSIGSFTSSGAIAGYLIAKPVCYELLRRVNLEMLYILDEGTFRVGLLASDRLHSVIIEEVKEAVGEY